MRIPLPYKVKSGLWSIDSTNVIFESWKKEGEKEFTGIPVFFESLLNAGYREIRNLKMSKEQINTVKRKQMKEFEGSLEKRKNEKTKKNVNVGSESA